MAPLEAHYTDPPIWRRLKFTLDAASDFKYYVDITSDSLNGLSERMFPAQWHGVNIKIGVGKRIETGAFKIYLEGYFDGPSTGESRKFIGYLKPGKTDGDDILQLDMLISSEIDVLIHDRLNRGSECQSRMHGPSAEDRFTKNMDIDQSYETISLLVRRRCRTCLIAEHSAAPDFADLVPDAEPSRSWR
jgi:hypothetical protein